MTATASLKAGAPCWTCDVEKAGEFEAEWFRRWPNVTAPLCSFHADCLRAVWADFQAAAKRPFEEQRRLMKGSS